MKLFFSRKRSIVSRPFSTYSNVPVAQRNPQKDLGMQLDHVLPRSAFVIIYKSFIRSRLDYGGIKVHYLKISLYICVHIKPIP